MADASDNRTAFFPNLLLATLTLACLLPFVAKPFHIDDPLFLWSAKHIQTHPFDPFGFQVNWDHTLAPMWAETKNPPLTCYYLALAMRVFGSSEVALHLAFLPFALAVVLGTYTLARSLCSLPLLAALATLLTPVFLVCSTSVMCDTMMLAFWVWAVVLWRRGLERNQALSLVSAGLLIGAAALTKYFGVCLVPLLLVYSVVHQRRIGWWAACLLIPLLIVAAYEFKTHSLYGQGLFSTAAGFASHSQRLVLATLTAKGMIGLSFLGGCGAAIGFYTPWLWQRKVLLAGAGVVGLVTALIFSGEKMATFSPAYDGTSQAWVGAQAALMALAAASLLALAVLDFLKHRDADSTLLCLWVLGTFVFATFLNWTNNGRSLLPLVPAAGILLARRLQAVTVESAQKQHVLWPLVPAAMLSMLVAWSDAGQAQSARDAAREVHQLFARNSRAIWFQGHWGFHYYLDALGAKVMDIQRSQLKPGDVVVVPTRNVGSFPLPPGNWQQLDSIHHLPNGCLSAMCREVGAGFYASAWGPLPFALGRVPFDTYEVFLLQPKPASSPVPPR